MKTFQISRHYLAVVALLSGANSYVTASGFDFGAEPISTDSTTRNEAAIGRTLSESISSAISQISLRSHRDDIPATDGPPASCMISDDALFWPFCKPTNGSHLYVDKTYSITWDPSAIKATDSIIVSLNYHEATPSIRTSSFAAVSNEAWTSPKQPLSRSSTTVTMSPDWLQGHIRNDLFVSILLLNSSSTPDSPYPRATKIRGPSVTLTKKPVRQRPPHVSQLCKMGLVIGLPVGLVVALAVIAFACVCRAAIGSASALLLEVTGNANPV